MIEVQHLLDFNEGLLILLKKNSWVRYDNGTGVVKMNMTSAPRKKVCLKRQTFYFKLVRINEITGEIPAGSVAEDMNIFGNK